MKKVLITGANSYIGTHIEQWLKQWPEQYSVDTIDVTDNIWREKNFTEYDMICHVAGIAHRKETKENAQLYYEVNEKLAVDIARKAKAEGVKQFLILSSMSVYGMTTGHITKQTKPSPNTHYGISKNNADIQLVEMEDDNFKVAILRPPMVYGRNCKGNYQTLRKFALKIPFFPEVKNNRSMIYVEHLAEFVQKRIDKEDGGIFFPQDAEYVNTSVMVREIAKHHGKKLHLTKLCNPAIVLGEKLGAGILKKVFGSLTYEKCDLVSTCSFEEIMKQIEAEDWDGGRLC